MSTALIALGFERPKLKLKQLRLSLRDVFLTAAWVSLVLMVGLSIAASIQSSDYVAYDSAISQGL